MQGQWISQTRKLNRHYQSVGIIPTINTEFDLHWDEGNPTSYQVNVQSIFYDDGTLSRTRAYDDFAGGIITPVIEWRTRVNATTRAICAYITLCVDVEQSPNVYDHAIVYTWQNQNSRVTGEGGFNIEVTPPTPSQSQTVQITGQTQFVSPGFLQSYTNYGKELTFNALTDILPGIQGITLSSLGYASGKRVKLSGTVCLCIDKRIVSSNPAIGGLKIKFEKR